MPLETIARVVSWAIFGVALQWSREPVTVSSSQMAQDIYLVIIEGVAHLAPDALPQYSNLTGAVGAEDYWISCAKSKMIPSGPRQ